MAQKDKVKELVGRGLGSYHTKSLQQIDRIERKNKEQNHKISILTNELDNDYLTKTEEGSVISLDHSKEGMIYLDELQGNTLVNYCSDGSKELTLNGDIDVEGTNVTLTEGVDNGKVDVVCEGNTLVNLVNMPHILHCTNNEGRVKKLNFNQPLKVGGTYTLLFNVYNTNGIQYEVGIYNPSQGEGTWLKTFNGDNFHQKVFTLNHFTDSHQLWIWVQNNSGGTFSIDNVTLLEGDWTNREIPKEYFEGMKSVGECEDNKFEISSVSANLFDKELAYSNIKKDDINNTVFRYNEGNRDIIKFKQSGLRLYIGDKFEKNTQYSLKLTGRKLSTLEVSFSIIYTDNTHTSVKIGTSEFSSVWVTSNSGKTISCIRSLYSDGEYNELDLNDIVLVKGVVQNSVPHKSDKKEISLNEPLRGLSSGVKDYFIKQGGKWYIQRNVGEYIFKGNEINSSQGSVNETNLLYWSNAQSTLKNKTNVNEVLSDKLPHGKQGTSNTEGIEGISFNGTGQNLLVDVKKTMAETNEFLKDSKIIYQLETPIYEEITDVELTTYLDTTHISNNSTIPCTMKIKNTGYNAIIKPSTKYTVALDTNKSGTIGINLGGAKVTKANNVATITTPATLTDDSLRLYGKGIKASKIRLLEGDKTNWIPSHFEGMQSCFEDKLQDDGTYKMEILSNNKNLLDIYNGEIEIQNSSSSVIIKDGIITLTTSSSYGTRVKYLVDFKIGKKYLLSSNFGFNGSLGGSMIIRNLEDEEVLRFSSGSGVRPMKFTAMRTQYYIVFEVYGNNGTFAFSDIILQEDVNGEVEHTLHKQNKIQFSSIEPLRSVGNYKDKLIFKDNKLMIERNIHRFVANGNYVAHITKGSYENDKSCSVLLNLREEPKHKRTKDLITVKCDKYPSYPHTSALWMNTFYEHKGISNVTDVWDFGVRDYNFNTLINPSDDASVMIEKYRTYLNNNPLNIEYVLAEPTYEEVPYELAKIILEGYENGTLFFDTNIPPTSTVTYAGETPIVKSVRLNKTEVLNNSNDINDNIVPYLMDMDYRVVCLQLEGEIENVSIARLFGGTFEMLQRDILSNRYSKEEYKYRLDAYLSANKITENEYEKLGDMLND